MPEKDTYRRFEIHSRPKINTTNREYSARAICWSFPLSSTTLCLETPRGGGSHPAVRPKVAKHRIRARVNHFPKFEMADNVPLRLMHICECTIVDCACVCVMNRRWSFLSLCREWAVPEVYPVPTVSFVVVELPSLLHIWTGEYSASPTLDCPPPHTQPPTWSTNPTTLVIQQSNQDLRVLSRVVQKWGVKMRFLIHRSSSKSVNFRIRASISDPEVNPNWRHGVEVP